MKEREAVLSHQRLIEALDYDRGTGIFTWKNPASPRMKMGDIAGTLDRYGHRRITVNNLLYMAHRLAWFYVYERWPPHDIDHKNLAKDDNRIDNLRESTRGGNSHNRTKRVDNQTGFKGVSHHWRDKHKFQARICANGKQIFLGLYSTPQEAHAAYVEASAKYHGEYGRAF